MSDSLDKNYALAGYHNQQTWGSRPALLMIDFAQAYFDVTQPLFGGEGCQFALDNAIELAPAARASGIPVIFTEVVYKPGGRDGGAFFHKAGAALRCFEAGRDSQKLAKGLSMEQDDIMVSKQYPSAFFGTSLASTLHWMRVDTVFLTGVTTSGCVRASCVDSMSHGFTTVVVKDAVGDRATAPHEANLYDMSAKYADLCTTEEAVNWFASIE